MSKKVLKYICEHLTYFIKGEIKGEETWVLTATIKDPEVIAYLRKLVK